MKLVSTMMVAALAALLSLGCYATIDAPEADESGKLILPLQATSPSGVIYQLRNAFFAVTGPVNFVVPPQDPPPPEISTETQSGRYQVLLEDGWEMWHSANGQAFTPIDALLLSDNPLSALVRAEQDTRVTFQFRVEEGDINFGPGNLLIDFEVEEAPILRRWATAEPIDAQVDLIPQEPQVAMDAQGNAVAVWSEAILGSGEAIWANRYTRSTGWGTAEAIATTTFGFGGEALPQVAMDAQGNAVAVWSFRSGVGTSNNIWSARFTPSGGWGAAELIGSGDGASDSQVAANAQGDAAATWTQFSGAGWDVWANIFTPSGGWGAAQAIENGADIPSPDPAPVAMDDQGNAIAVWDQPDGTADSIWANRFTPTGGWETAQVIENSAERALNPKIAMNAQGEAVAVWGQAIGAVLNNIRSNQFTPAGGWGTAELVQVDAFPTDVGLDDQGNAIVVWPKMARRSTPTGGWGDAVVIDTNAGSTRSPRLAMNGDGDAVAVWDRMDATDFNVWSNIFTPTGGWLGTEQIDFGPGAANDPQVAIDPAGNAVAVWSGFPSRIWANVLSE